MGMEIVTGSTGAAHVTPVDDAVRNGNSGYLNDNSVFDVYDKFAATIRTSNLVRIGSGYGMMQGRLFKISELDYEDLIIDNGSQGVKRCDLICARYSMSQQTGYEKIELVVLKGDSGQSYVKPQTLSGNINGETKQADFPLYEVHINGITLESCTALFTPLPDGGRIGLIEKDLKEHKESSDPHRITFVDTGAGDVVNIVSRESFSIIFKKIATAIKALTDHISNKQNPHSVKGSQLADTVPIEKGGTGATTAAGAAQNIGLTAHINNKSNPHAVKGSQLADAVPISKGGTGATSKAGALANLGIPSNVADSMAKSVYDCRIDDAPINYAVSVNEHTSDVNVECNSQTGIFNVTSKELKGSSDDLMVAAGLSEGQYKAIVQVAHSEGYGWTHRNIGSGIFYWIVTTDTDNRSWSEIKAANMIASHDITTNPSFDVPKDGIAYIVYKNDNNGSISFEKNDKIRMMIVKATANADGVDLFDDNIYNYRARNITLREDMRQALQDMKASFQGGVDKIVQAIKANGVTPSASTPTACEAAINSIRSGGNATAAQILKGQTAIVNKETVTGTMANNGAVSKAINAGDSYTIPAGYHNGSGKVTANNPEWTEVFGVGGGTTVTCTSGADGGITNLSHVKNIKCTSISKATVTITWQNSSGGQISAVTASAGATYTPPSGAYKCYIYVSPTSNTMPGGTSFDVVRTAKAIR